MPPEPKKQLKEGIKERDTTLSKESNFSPVDIRGGVKEKEGEEAKKRRF